MEVAYLNAEGFSIDISFFDAFVVKLRGQIEVRPGILNVVFVNDEYIHALNKAYRGKDKPTDVLSFNYENEDGLDSNEELLGEIYVSVETAERQSVEHQLSRPEELAKLIVHGILHVHGYDHVEDADYKKMFAVEQAILGKIAGEFLH